METDVRIMEEKIIGWAAIDKGGILFLYTYKPKK